MHVLLGDVVEFANALKNALEYLDGFHGDLGVYIKEHEILGVAKHLVK